MSTNELVAIMAAIGALITALIAWRRAPADIRKSESEARKLVEEADQVQVGTSLSLVNTLQAKSEKQQVEIDGLRARLDASDKREYETARELFDLKARLSNAESRAVQAETRANEYRQDIIRVGTQFDQERRDNRDRVNKLALILGKLLSQIKTVGHNPDLNAEDLAMLDKLISIGQGGGMA